MARDLSVAEEVVVVVVVVRRMIKAEFQLVFKNMQLLIMQW